MKWMFLIIAIWSLLLMGCQEELEAQSEISKFRVLALQAEPPEIVLNDGAAINVLYAHPKPEQTGGLDAGMPAPTKVETAWIPIPGKMFAGEPENMLFGVELLIVPRVLSELSEEEMEMLDLSDVFDAYITSSDTGISTFEIGTVAGDPAKLHEKLYATFFIIMCSNGQIDRELMGQLLQPTDENSDVMDEFSEDFSGLEQFCIPIEGGEAPEVVVAKKELVIRREQPIDEDLNQNPQIESLKMGVRPDAEFNPELGPISYICLGDDGCRDSINIEARLTSGSAQMIPSESGASSEKKNEALYISWYADNGKFNKDRSGASEENNADGGAVPDKSDPLFGDESFVPYEAEWRPDVNGGPATIYAVVNDRRRGVSWRKFDLTTYVNHPVN